MTKKIFKSIYIAAICICLAAVCSILAVVYAYVSNIEKTNLQSQLEFIAAGVEESGDVFLGYSDGEEYRVTWIDPEGNILYDNEADASDMDNHLDREEISEAFENGFGDSVRYSDTLMTKYYYCAALLSDGTVIRLGQEQSSVLYLFLKLIPYVIIILGLAALVSYFLSRWLSRNIVKPLNEVDLDNPLSGSNYKELRPLLVRIDDQKKQLEKDRQTLEQTEKIRQEFTANVSHELKTPLHSISGYSELMAAGVVKTEDMQRFAQKIYNESRRMTNLVEDILYLGRLDSGANDMMWEICDLYAIAKTAVEDLKPVADKGNIKIIIKGENAMIHGIPKLLESIVYNICDNAVKYNKEGGYVAVSVLEQEDTAVLIVEDTGVGISKENQERIFERFFRVDKSRSREVGGTGLGLSIVKHAVLIHNARIKVESTPGVGSTFMVIFPKN